MVSFHPHSILEEDTLHFIHKAKWRSGLGLKAQSHQAAIGSCLFSCPHPAPSNSLLVSAPPLVSPSSPFTFMTQLFRAAFLMPSLEALLSSCLVHLSPWALVPWGSAPSTTCQLKPGLALCCPLLAWAGTSTAPQVLCSVLIFHFLSISGFERTVLVWHRVSWYFPQLSISLTCHTYTWKAL